MAVMDEVYRLSDSRCNTDTALDKPATLRSRVKRFEKLGEVLKKLYSPNLERALTLLDDYLLPSTSNAVERANRRYRKTQKSIYRVRTKAHISQRIALDMQRDLNMKHAPDTIYSLQTEGLLKHGKRDSDYVWNYATVSEEVFKSKLHGLLYHL